MVLTNPSHLIGQILACLGSLTFHYPCTFIRLVACMISSLGPPPSTLSGFRPNGTSSTHILLVLSAHPAHYLATTLLLSRSMHLSRTQPGRPWVSLVNGVCPHTLHSCTTILIAPHDQDSLISTSNHYLLGRDTLICSTLRFSSMLSFVLCNT